MTNLNYFPLISVIVPAYNIENYIENCLESIIRQTYKNLEIIVIDDGSTDNTGKIIDNFSNFDKRIKVIHKKNEGVSKARLLGVEESKGEYIGFVDGDDQIEKYMYEHLLNNALKYRADISHCGYQMNFPDGHVDYYYNSKMIIEQNKDKGLKDLLEGKYIEPGLWNKLFKRQLFTNLIKEMDFDIKINEDLLMNFYLFNKSNKSIYEDVCLYHYILRKNSASTSKLNENKLEDPLKVLKLLLNKTAGNLEIYNVVYKRYINQLINISTLSLKEQKELIYTYRKKIRRELKKQLVTIFKSNCGIKIKMFSLWVSIWPKSYTFVHFIYAKVKKIDKKYQI
ncbi:glycosyltransferase family 2 protein [Erysipelatoclostridium sp. An173]|uniref:glycosyltransferase family 2 protein n=1 Tax=Erysipelatoclostridium sp. An173 TaxID=1965571 RepID=UPI0032080767